MQVFIYDLFFVVIDYKTNKCYFTYVLFRNAMYKQKIFFVFCLRTNNNIYFCFVLLYGNITKKYAQIFLN